ncbi:hypothetical protein BDV29DRAFT_161022 [Aspergillus leporis]|uniref:Uncharacterized protein n=1 Tax=Aspergillus leporis TaxID=41062 RepID=A0A5N5WQ29_9EURO|nr:hypothetical protein BDV29DRAFT_161022 [Aspergillus leporis]
MACINLLQRIDRLWPFSNLSPTRQADWNCVTHTPSGSEEIDQRGYVSPQHMPTEDPSTVPLRKRPPVSDLKDERKVEGSEVLELKYWIPAEIHLRGEVFYDVRRETKKWKASMGWPICQIHTEHFEYSAQDLEDDPVGRELLESRERTEQQLKRQEARGLHHELLLDDENVLVL